MAVNSNDLKLTLRFNAENKEFLGQVNASAGAIDNLGSKTNRTSTKLGTLADESHIAGSGLSSLKGQVLGLAGGFSTLAIAINAKDTLGRYQDIRTQITALVGGHKEWITTEQYLNQVAEEHNKTILDMSSNYARLAVLQEAGLVTQRETQVLFEGMSNAQSQLGATSVQLDQAMYGLSQALGSPIVRAEELNQVVEPLPGLLNKLDKAAGLPSGGFRQMMLDGQVTSQFFKTTLIDALGEYEGAAARTAENVNAQQAAFSRAHQQMVLAYEQPISDVFSNSISASTTVLNTFADNAELITDVVGVAMFAALGRGTAAAAALTATKVQSVIATRQEIQAEVQKTSASLASVQAEIRHLQAMRLTNNERFRATGATHALAAAEAKEKVIKDSLTAAQARLNVTMRAGTALMAALGGPAGIAMMAAGAIGYFALTNSEAKKKTDQFSESIESLLGQMDKLEEKRLQQGLNERMAALTAIELQIETLSNRRGTNQLAERNRNLKQLREQEAQLRGDIIALEDQLAGVGSRPAPKTPNTPPKEDKDTLKAGERMLANLARQAALYGETSEVAKVKYEIEKGALKGVNDELKEQLLLQAQIIDKKRAAKEAKKDKPKTDKIDDFFESSDDLNSEYLQRLAIQADYENKAKIQEQYAYAERQDQLKLQFEEAYAQAQGNQSLMHALESEYFQNRQVLRQQHEMNLTDISKNATDERKAYQERVAMDTLTFTQQQLSITTDFLKQSGKENTGLYKTLFLMQKAAAIPSMIVATEEAAAKTMAAFPAPYGTALAASVRALGYSSVGIVAGTAIAGVAHDGINRVPKENEGTWLLKANEMVLNPSQADNFRWMVGMMQQMKALFGAMSAARAPSPTASGVVVNIHPPTGTQTRKEESTTSDGIAQLDFYIEQAKEKTLDALYEDADNGGPISTRIRASA